MKNNLLLLTLFFGTLIASTAIGQVINTFPFIEDFESQPAGPTGCAPSYSLVGNTWHNGDDPLLALPLSTTHQIDWTTESGPTGSSLTGPSTDHTTGTAAGQYLYAETSCPPTANFELISPYLNFTSTLNPQFEFWYNAYGSTIGMLYVDAVVGSTGSWAVLDSVTDNIDLWQMLNVDMSAYNNLDSVRIRLRYSGSTNFYGDLGIDDLKVFDLVPLDAGVIAINAPLNPVTPGLNNVDVTVGSFGSDTLTSASIQWTVNGAPQTPAAWTGNLGYLQTDPNYNIGAYNFVNGLTTVKVWTTSPNGGIDQQNGNDTTEMTFCTPLIGNYTVGGAGADFADLTILGDMLSTCGVGGNVYVTVNPGAYTGRMILDHVPGTSALATVTIDGVDTSLVSLTNASFSNIYVYGTDYVTVKNMKLINTGTIDAYGIQLADTAMYNTFDSLKIEMSLDINLSDVIGVSASNTETSSFTEGQNALYTTVSNSHIIGGEKGIHFEGQGLLRTIGNKFLNNIIDQAEDYGFYMDDQDSIDIIGNTISNIRNASGDAIYTFDLMMFNISYNEALDVPDWGLYISDGNFDAIPTGKAKIVNNMISSQSDYAFYLDDVNEVDIWHNTFYGNPGMFSNDLLVADVRNNIFMSDVDYAFESLDDVTTAGMVLNYNNYWTPVSNTFFVKDGVAIHADLATWFTAAPTLNLNSTEVDPIFINGTSDLHPLNPGVNDTGDNTVGILDDIEGDSRPAGVNVDMGADEFTPIADDLELLEVIVELPCGDSLTEIQMVVRNLGTNIVSSFVANADVSGDAIANLSLNYTGLLNFAEIDTFTIGFVNTYWGENFDVLAYVTLANDANNSNDTLSTSFYHIPYEPIGYGGYACGDTSAWVWAEPVMGAQYNWFATSNQAIDTIPIALGDSLFVPNVGSQPTYYLEYANNQDSLLTTMAGGNGCGAGNMFDMTAINTITWTGVDVNCSSAIGAAVTVNVYYIPGGTFNGNETNPGAWTSLGSFNTTSAGGGAMTYVDFGTSTLNIPGGSTYAIYVEFPANYTNGSFTYSNSDISITTGIGLCSAFGGTNNPRSFNGQIHYGSTACSNIRVPVTAQIGSFADPSFTAAPTASGNDVAFTNSGAPQNIAYAWDYGDGSAIDTTANPTHNFAVDSTYVVCLTATSVCGDSTWCDTMDVCETMSPDFDFSVSGNGYVYGFNDLTSGTPTSWAWDFGDGNTSTSQNPSHTYASTDATYTVTLTVTNYCGETEVSTQTVNVVNVESLSLDQAVKLSPNPSNGLFNIFYTGMAKGKAELSVLDIQGRVLVNETLDTDGEMSKEIDLRSYSDGTYFLKIVLDGAQIEKQLVKASK